MLSHWPITTVCYWHNGHYSILTTWSIFLLEKLTGCQLVKNFPAFYGSLWFITAFTSARHLSLSWVRSFQSMPPHIPLPEDPSYYYLHIYAWVFQVVSFPQVSPPKPCIYISPPPSALHTPPISFFSIWSDTMFAHNQNIVSRHSLLMTALCLSELRCCINN